MQRAMEFLDTPEPTAGAAAMQRPPHAAVQFEPTGAAATPDGAEVGNVPPETPLPGIARSSVLPEGGWTSTGHVWCGSGRFSRPFCIGHFRVQNPHDDSCIHCKPWPVAEDI